MMNYCAWEIRDLDLTVKVSSFLSPFDWQWDRSSIWYLKKFSIDEFEPAIIEFLLVKYPIGQRVLTGMLRYNQYLLQAVLPKIKGLIMGNCIPQFLTFFAPQRPTSELVLDRLWHIKQVSDDQDELGLLDRHEIYLAYIRKADPNFPLLMHLFIWSGCNLDIVLPPFCERIQQRPWKTRYIFRAILQLMFLEHTETEADRKELFFAVFMKLTQFQNFKPTVFGNALIRHCDYRETEMWKWLQKHPDVQKYQIERHKNKEKHLKME